MTTCLHCGAEISNGLGLCDLARRFVTDALGFLPTYFANLSRWQPGRAGSRPVPGSRVLFFDHDVRQGTGDKISDQLDETLVQLAALAEKVATARPYLRRLLDRLTAAKADGRIDDGQYIDWLCRGFIRFLPSIATLDMAGDFVRAVASHEEKLRRFTEEYVPGWYAGACANVVDTDDQGNDISCGAGTYAVPGLTWIVCGACGDTTAARDHIETILTEAAGWVGTPKRLAEAVVALVDTEQSVPRLYTRIRQWAFVGELEPVQRMGRGYVWDDDTERMVVGTVKVGTARYRMGDVLQIVLRPTRSLKSHVS